MKQVAANIVFGTVGLFIVVFCVITAPTEVAAQDYRFKMWIAPIECTRNEISDGVATNVILTPEQCNDYLHPPTKPQPGKPNQPQTTPNAPDTGKFSDIWTNVGMVSLLSIFGASILMLIVHDRQRPERKALQKKRR